MALEHGGRVRAAAEHYGIPLNNWLDLSTGINPDSWPLPAIPAEIWQQLPQVDDGLLEAARGFYGTSELLAVAGSQAAIQALPGLRPPCRVAILAVSYAEHAHAWQQHGHQVCRVTEEEILQTDAQVVVIVNPNNPTARRFSGAELLDLHQRLLACDGWLVVDEAFMDVTPEHSLAAFCPRKGLIVLRSLGKFFGLAGARVGFVLAEMPMLNELAERLGPWPVAAPSRYVAMLALQDTCWQRATRLSLLAGSQRLVDMLARHGFLPIFHNPLFIWLKDKNAANVHKQLAQQGILTRLFEQPASLRFGLPFGEGAWARLDAALGETNLSPAFRPVDLDVEGFASPPLHALKTCPLGRGGA
jgi:L-threonine-O-3-phosphate decarboxylase